MDELKQTQANSKENKGRLKTLRTLESKQANETFDMNGIKTIPPPKL